MKIFRVFTTTDRLDPSLLKRSLILWDSFMMKLNTMLRNNIQCSILTTKFILHKFTLLLPFFFPFLFFLFFFFFFFFSFFFFFLLYIFLFWRWLSHKFQSLSTAIVLFRTTFTRTIILIQPTYESSYRKVCNWKTNWAEWN